MPIHLFSPRLHLVVIFIAGLCCGCSGLFRGESEYEQQKKKEQGFAGLVEAAGGSAIKEGRILKGFTGVGWFVNLEGAEISSQLLDALVTAVEKDPVYELVLSGSTITDEQLAILDAGKVLQKVIVLDLSKTAITDAGLDKLKNHYVISDLKLSGSQATTAGAKRLGDRQIASPQTPQPFKKQPELDI